MKKIDIVNINNMIYNMNTKTINDLTYLLGYWKNSWSFSPHKFHLSRQTANKTHIIGQHLSSIWFDYNSQIEGSHTFILLGVTPDVTSKAMQKTLNCGDDSLIKTIEYFLIRGDEMQKYLGGKYMKLNGRINSNNILNFSINPQHDATKISLTLPNFVLQVESVKL